ncbi:MAG: DJ-1/PfpI family protein [Candidatus Micrarchaeia archaeon]
MKMLTFITKTDFKDESLSLVKTFFEKWKIENTIATYSATQATGYHGSMLPVGIDMAKAKPADYEGIVLIDGKGIESSRIYEYRPLLDMVTMFNNANKYIIAFDNAIKVVARANIIANKRVSAYDTELKRLVLLFHGIPVEEPIVRFNNLITLGNSKLIENQMVNILKYIGVA